MEIIKNLLYFDDSINYNQTGGAGMVAKQVLTNPKAQQALQQGVQQAGQSGQKAGQDSSGSGNSNSNNNNNKNTNNVEEISELSEFATMIIVVVKDNYKKFKNFLLGYFVIPIMFGSFAPALPFFVVMAAMFAILKYFMGIFRKL
jgi:hypothetical protein